MHPPVSVKHNNFESIPKRTCLVPLKGQGGSVGVEDGLVTEGGDRGPCRGTEGGSVSTGTRLCPPQEGAHWTHAPQWDFCRPLQVLRYFPIFHPLRASHYGRVVSHQGTF